MAARSSGCSGCGLVGCAVVALPVMLLVAIIGSNTPHPAESSAPPAAASSTNTADYDAGFARGQSEGADHARSGAGMPLPIGMNGMAELYAEGAHPTDTSAWKEGFKSGFVAGFKSIKAFNRNDADWDQLSWQNAHHGTKLYDYGGKHVATIRSIDRDSGLIVVRYRSGEIEPKELAAVAPYWWVRRR